MEIETLKIDYAILSSMPEELEFFIEKFSGLACFKIKINSFEFKIYDYLNHKILITYTGIGTTFAASVLTLIYCYFKPSYVFISGTAGGINRNLKLNDVVIAENAFEAEIQNVFSIVKDTPFESCLMHPLKHQGFPPQYSADKYLLKMSESLSIPNINIYRGTVVTSNAFPAPKELFEQIKKFNAYSIDMETSAFYQTAWLLNIKILAVRGISNLLNSDGSDDELHASDITGSSHAANTIVYEIINKMIRDQ